LSLARIESLKKSSGIMVVRGRTLPELTSCSSRSAHGGHRSDLSKWCFISIKFENKNVDFQLIRMIVMQTIH